MKTKRSAIKVVQDLIATPTDDYLSEGEEIILNFLEDEGFTVQQQVTITGLDRDNCGYRVVDFYLPKYDLFIEFFGRWNYSKEERERYREKMRVYHANYLPCVYLYPENLGTLDHSFDRRAREVMQRYRLKGLRKFNFKYWRDDHRIELYAIPGLLILGYNTPDLLGRLIVGVFLLWILIYLGKEWFSYNRPLHLKEF